MIVRVSEIPDQGLCIESIADLAGVFTDEGWALDGVELTVERHGGKVTVAGAFHVTARMACSRCLEPLATKVSPEVDLHLFPAPTARHEQVELLADDLEIDFYRGDMLDVGGLVRSETALALPMKPLCRPDCRGLCPGCGANRNVTACACSARPVDPRLAPLEAFRRARTD